MQKKYSSLLCFFLISIIYSQEKFPFFEDIATTFFETYTLRNDQTYHDIRFVKGIQGYSIEEYNIATDSYDRKQLLWSAEKKGYLTLNLAKNTTAIDTVSEAFLKYANTNIHLFNKLPYYGYPYWKRDVIQLLKEKENLTDDELYALGRAYCSLATALLSNNSGFADTSTMFPVKEIGQNQLTKLQLKTYRTYLNKGIQAYRQLCEINPEYPTIVGSICTKLHNEYTSSFLNLRMYQNEKEALKELPKELYSDLYLDFAKNLLDSCEPNAILFTVGDNDTFPLLYIQARKAYRQDVTVINLSLLNDNKYTNYIRTTKVFKADAIAMQLSTEAYKGEQLGYVILQSSEKEIALTTALQLINKNDPIIKNAQQPMYPNILSNRLKISLKNEKPILLHIDKNYIFKGDLIALDMIQANNGKRPIHFTLYSMPMLKDYLELNGFNYKLTAEPRIKIDDPYYGGINEENTFIQLTETFNFKPIEHIEEATQVALVYNYQDSFRILIQHYRTTNNSKKCAVVLKKYISFFPEALYLKTRLSTLDIIINAYHLGLTSEGDIITQRLLNSITIDLDNIQSKKEEIKNVLAVQKDTKDKVKSKTRQITYILRELEKNMDADTEMYKKVNTMETHSSRLFSELIH